MAHVIDWWQMVENTENPRETHASGDEASGRPNAGPAPAMRFHPPTSPGPISRSDEGRIWPPLIGIAVLVLQGFGLLSSIGSAIMQFMDFRSIFGGIAPSGTFDAAEKWKPAMLAMYGAAGALSIVALVGAVMLLMRRRWGVRLLVGWSILRLPYAFVSASIVTAMQRDNMSAMGGAAGPPGMTSAIYVATYATTLLMSLALPVALLVWFALPAVRRQVRGWL